MGVERPRARVTWDEAGIQAHDAERGVRFGTMKIDQPDTPFLFLDADDPCGEIAAIHPKYLATHVPTAERTGAGPAAAAVPCDSNLRTEESSSLLRLAARALSSRALF